MKINFIPTTTGKDGNYDLLVEGRDIVLDITPKEAIKAIEEISTQRDVILQVDLFHRAIEKLNLQTPDPSITPGNTQMLFIEGEVPKGGWGVELRVYDRVLPDSSSYLIFTLFYIGGMDATGKPMEQCAWAFYIGRSNKEIGKVIGWCDETPTGEVRQRIISDLIPRLGRNLKILI